jgi:nucleoside-diphosphate-sugar epimerase
MSLDREVILITGVGGLIGTALAERWANDYRVVGLDILDTSPTAPLELYLQVDLSTDEKVREGLDILRRAFGDRIASIVHLASFLDYSGEPSRLYEEVTVRGTARLLRWLEPFDLDQFIFSSTMLIHCACDPGERITEDWPVRPSSDFPRSKRDAEDLIRHWRGDTRVVFARIAGVYTDDCDFVPLARQIRRIRERTDSSHAYPGDPGRGQAVVHLDDLVDALGRMVERRHHLAPEQAILIGEEETVGYGRLQQMIGDLIHGETWETHQVPKAVARSNQGCSRAAEGDSFIRPWMVDMVDEHYALDTSRASELLGWKASHSLKETLPTIIQRLEADPPGWYRRHDL